MSKSSQKPCLFGIKNCDSVKKARKWLDNAGVDYDYHDFREDGISAAIIEDWLQAGVTHTLINKRSTTWKQLDEDARALIEAIVPANGDILSPTASEKKKLIATLLGHPTVIKRPVVSWPAAAGKVSVGFSIDAYNELVSA